MKNENSANFHNRKQETGTKIEKLVISVAETAKILGISLPTAYALTYRADFPAFHIGRRALVDRAGLEQWISAQAGSHQNLEV